jgi:hypothetical protein
MDQEKLYHSFTAGFARGPLGYVPYIDCINDEDSSCERVFLLPAVFATESQVKEFLETVVVALMEEFGCKRVMVV